MPTVAKRKQRSIDSLQPLLPTYNAGQRVGPPQSKSTDADTAVNTQLARENNLVWVLAQMGFNIQTRSDMTVIPDNVGYLPTINAPATQFSTVNEVLNQSLSIMRSLGLTKIVCVFDQAFYAKILEIINMLTSSRVSSSGLAYFTPSAHCWQ